MGNELELVHEHNGIEYKIGRHGFLFRWSSARGEWVRSELHPSEVNFPMGERGYQPRSRQQPAPEKFNWSDKPNLKNESEQYCWYCNNHRATARMRKRWARPICQPCVIERMEEKAAQ